MPIENYFRGHGKEVLAGMQKKNGDEAGKREFYATANAKNMKPEKPRDGAMARSTTGTGGASMTSSAPGKSFKFPSRKS